MANHNTACKKCGKRHNPEKKCETVKSRAKKK